MKMCDEMIKLRNALDEKGVQWEDKSYTDKTEHYKDILRECLLLLRTANFAQHEDTIRANMLYDRIEMALYEK